MFRVKFNKAFARFKAIGVATLLLLFNLAALPSEAAAPPVRIAVVTGGGSGIEQDIVDRITNRLSANPNVSISTVNPDWYVVCNIKEFMDQMSGQIRYNGNVLVKTGGGQVLSSIAVQQYKQDFSLSPGAPLNKALVDRAAREATAGAADRVIPQLEQAIQIEMDTREKIIQAQISADGEQYDAAINQLRFVSPDSPHFQNARDLMNEFEMEKESLENLKKAESIAKQGKYSSAIAILKNIPKQSKYKAKANGLAASYSAALKRASAPKIVKKSSSSSKVASGDKQADLKALDKVLKIEKQAIEDAQSKVKGELNK